jgi:hypothetical protein
MNMNLEGVSIRGERRWYDTHNIRMHAESIVIYVIGVSLFYAILLLLVVE